MKLRNKLSALVVGLLLVSATTSLSAQAHFGIKGGLNFMSLSKMDFSSIGAVMKSQTGFNVGVAAQFKVPLIGFVIQPELLYTTKGANFSQSAPGTTSAVNTQLKMSYLELPINLQMGLDLILFRPFIEFSPYIGYVLSNNMIDLDKTNRFEYGLGVGAGVDIWKFQFKARYCWNLGNLANFNTDSVVGTIAKDIFKGEGNVKGLELSVGFFF